MDHVYPPCLDASSFWCVSAVAVVGQVALLRLRMSRYAAVVFRSSLKCKSFSTTIPSLHKDGVDMSLCINKAQRKMSTQWTKHLFPSCQFCIVDLGRGRDRQLQCTCRLV